MRHLLAAAAVATLSGPALACLNDTELISHEREFRSQYRDSHFEPPPAVPTGSLRQSLIGGSGVLMALVGAGLLYRHRGRA